MAIGQGIYKQVVIKKQTGLGAAASGIGGQIIRRESSTNKLSIASFDNNELASHQQDTGKTHGLRSVELNLSGVLSPNTYSLMLGSLVRKDFAATAALTGLSLAIAGSAGTYTLTGTGLLVSGGFKVGDIVKFTAGTDLPTELAPAKNKNLLITAITNTVITVKTLNGGTITAAPTVTAATLALVGKKTLAPITGHTKDYYTIEDWHSDLSRSELFKDVMIGKAAVGLPSTGNATIQLSGVGIDRTLGATQVLTSPTVETTTLPLSAVNGILIVNGSAVTNVTGIQLNIDGKVSSMGAVIGTNVAPDIQRGIISVSGSFTALFQDTALQAAFEAGTQINLIAIVQNDLTDSAPFVTFSMSNIMLDSDDKDDGDKGIVRSYSFTARINPNGGAALANDNTIISIQDSNA